MNEIPFWLSVATALLAAAAGIGYGRRLQRNGFNLTAHVRVAQCPLIPVALLLFVLLQVATSTLLQDPRVGWALPVAVEYYLTPSMWMLKLFFVSFAMSAITTVGHAQGHARRHAIAVFTVLVILVVDGLNRYAVQPNLGEIQSKIEDGVILQTNASTCAAASAANIARRFGIEKTEADMVELLHTTWAGTSPAQLVYGFRKLGLVAEKVYHPDRDLSRVTPPAVLLVDFEGQPDAHAVAYMGRVGNFFEIWDPNSGRWAANLENVQARWGGRAIEVRRED